MTDAAVLRSHTRYRLAVANSLREYRYLVVDEAGRKTVATRDRRAGGHTLTQDEVLVGLLSRRRFRGRRTYDLELCRDIDPIPILAVAILIDQCRRMKWHMIFAG